MNKNKTALAIAAAIVASCFAYAELDPEVAVQRQYIKNHGLAPENAGHFERNRHPDAQWYPKAGMGLFIHWGLPSPSRNVPPNEYWRQI